MELLKDYTTTFMHYGEITVPKGTRVTHRTALGDDPNIHFVDYFGWVPPHECGIPQYGLLHDLKHYGLNVPEEYIKK
jgi:hypothetical protein